MTTLYAAINQTEYRLKVAFKSKTSTPLYQYIVLNQQGITCKFAAELEKLDETSIATMTKADWKKLMPKIEQYCEKRLGRNYTSYTLSLEKAFSYNDVIIVYFEPAKNVLTLSQLKRELKNLNIGIAAIESDKKLYSFHRSVKYYVLYIPKQYKNKLDQYIESVKDLDYIGYERP